MQKGYLFLLNAEREIEAPTWNEVKESAEGRPLCAAARRLSYSRPLVPVSLS